jgi:hypothetical protein
MTTISTIHTACKKCIFAIYNNITQVGCSLNYIEKFKEKKIEIVEAYDEDKEFYVINEKKCIGYRENSWLETHNIVNATQEEILDKYYTLNNISYISMIDTKNLSLDELISILNNLNSQKILPYKIFIIRHLTNTELEFDKLKDTLDLLQCPWKVQTCIDEEATLEYFIGAAISLNKKARFAMIVTEYTDNISNIVNTANDIVINELDSFMVLSDKAKTCKIFSASAYKYSRMNGENILKDDKQYKII